MHFFRQFFAYVKSHQDISKQNKTKQSKQQQKLPIFKELLIEDKNHEKQQSVFTDYVVEIGVQNRNNLNQTERSYMFGGRE